MRASSTDNHVLNMAGRPITSIPTSISLSSNRLLRRSRCSIKVCCSVYRHWGAYVKRTVLPPLRVLWQMKTGWYQRFSWFFGRWFAGQQTKLSWSVKYPCHVLPKVRWLSRWSKHAWRLNKTRLTCKMAITTVMACVSISAEKGGSWYMCIEF